MLPDNEFTRSATNFEVQNDENDSHVQVPNYFDLVSPENDQTRSATHLKYGTMRMILMFIDNFDLLLPKNDSTRSATNFLESGTMRMILMFRYSKSTISILFSRE